MNGWEEIRKKLANHFNSAIDPDQRGVFICGPYKTKSNPPGVKVAQELVRNLGNWGFLMVDFKEAGCWGKWDPYKTLAFHSLFELADLVIFILEQPDGSSGHLIELGIVDTLAHLALDNLKICTKMAHILDRFNPCTKVWLFYNSDYKWISPMYDGGILHTFSRIQRVFEFSDQNDLENKLSDLFD